MENSETEEEENRKNFDLFGKLITEGELQSPDSPDRRKSLHISLNESDAKSPNESNSSIEIEKPIEVIIIIIFLRKYIIIFFLARKNSRSKRKIFWGRILNKK